MRDECIWENKNCKKKFKKISFFTDSLVIYSVSIKSSYNRFYFLWYSTFISEVRKQSSLKNTFYFISVQAKCAPPPISHGVKIRALHFFSHGWLLLKFVLVEVQFYIYNDYYISFIQFLKRRQATIFQFRF
jgi:hypothetical protein